MTASCPCSCSLPKPASDGCRPTESLSLMSRFGSCFKLGRSLAYSGSVKGTRVLSPSFPPSSCTTTSTRRSRSGAAARAVRARKPGTVGARARSEECLRKSRRFNMARFLANRCRRSPESAFGRRPDQGDGAASPGRLVTREPPQRDVQPFALGRGGCRAAEQLAIERQQVRPIPAPAVPAGQPKRVEWNRLDSILVLSLLVLLFGPPDPHAFDH